jgi:hypothetical protein
LPKEGITVSNPESIHPISQAIADAIPDPSDQRAMAAIERFIGSPPENSRRFRISPEMAKYILDNFNRENRPIKPAKIKEYAEDMKAGNWGLTGDTVKFSNVGRLRDGQNRMHGCVLAGTPFETHVVFGIEDSLFSVMDKGKNRDGADHLATHGVTNAMTVGAAVRWAELIDTGRVKQRDTFQPREIFGMYMTKHGDVSNFVNIAKAISSVPSGMMTALLYSFDKKSPQDAADFAHAWSSGNRQVPFAAIAKAEKAIQRIKDQSGARIHDVVHAAMIVIAWNLFRSHRSGRLKDFNWDVVKDQFPTIK